MKKITSFLILMFTWIGISHADLFDSVRDKCVTVHFSTSIAATSTGASFLLVDLSDTANWPHKDLGAINISSMRIEIDKAAASTTTIRIGVVNFVNTSTGSVTWFFNSSSDLNVSNTGIQEIVSYAEGFVRTKVVPVNVSTGGIYSDGLTPYLISNEKTSGSTTYQTDVTIGSPITAGTAPGYGDIVMDVTKSAAAENIKIELIYFSDKK